MLKTDLNSTKMDKDIVIDHNHLYNIILAELLAVFPKSKTSFKFDTIYMSANLAKLESDDSYYWFKSLNSNHSDLIRHFLIRNGIIEESIENGYDSRLSEKGLAIVEAGSFEKYITNKEKQEKLQIEIQESILKTNKTIRITSYVTTFAVVFGLVLSGSTVYMARVAHLDSQKALELSNKSLELSHRSYLLQKKAAALDSFSYNHDKHLK